MSFAEWEFERLQKFAKVMRWLLYVPHIFSMCILFLCFDLWVPLIFLVVYVLLEKHLGTLADLVGFILGCIFEAPVALLVLLPLTSIGVWVGALYYKNKMQKLIQEMMNE